MRIREGEWKEKAGNLVTHTRIQYQDWAKSSKILTLMSRALRLSRRPLGRDRVGRGCGWKGRGQSCGGSGTHLIPWLMEVLPEIPGNSNCVLLGYGKQRPRAGGREQLLGGRAQSFALKVSGRTSATALRGAGEMVCSPLRAVLDSTAKGSSGREPRPPRPGLPPHTLLCSGLALRKPPLPTLPSTSPPLPGCQGAMHSVGLVIPGPEPLYCSGSSAARP